MTKTTQILPISHPVCGVLNRLLRSELAAVAAYERALAGSAAAGCATLHACCESHQTRTCQLRDHILQLGGKPATDAGAWGQATAAFVGGLGPFDIPHLLALLASGEDLSRREYESLLPEADPVTAEWLHDLMTEQERIRGLLSEHQRRAGAR